MCFRFRYFLYVTFIFLIIGNPVMVRAGSWYTTDRINFRKGPGEDKEIYSVLEKNTKLALIEKEGDWIKVLVDGKEGYVKRQYIADHKTKLSKKEILAQAPLVFVLKDEVNLREKPSKKSEALALLNTKTRCRVLKKKGKWISVFVEGLEKKGWVKIDYLSLTPVILRIADTDVTLAFREKALRYAHRHLGDKYSQKKRNKKGYADCSSLVRDAYFKASGVKIGENTTAQFDLMQKYIYPVSSLNQVAVGDLVYHLSGSNENHCGIYLGEGVVLHASQTKKKVKLTSFDLNKSTYWEYGCNAAAYCQDHR